MSNNPEDKKIIIPVFPLPEVVLLPGMNLPIHIFEERYKQMISSVLNGNKQFGVVLLLSNICAQVGTIAEIIDVENLEDGKMNILVEGKNRFKINSLISEEPYFVAQIQLYEDLEEEINSELKKAFKQIRKLSSKALNIFDKVSDQDMSKKIKLPEDPSELMYLITANLSCPYESKQYILESQSVRDRVDKVMLLLKDEIQRLEVLLENKKTKKEVVKNGKLKIYLSDFFFL